MSVTEPFNVPFETIGAHLDRVRKVALEEGIDHVVVALVAMGEENATIGTISLYLLERLSEEVAKMVVENQVPVCLSVYPNAAFSSFDQQAVALEAMERSGVS